MPQQEEVLDGVFLEWIQCRGSRDGVWLELYRSVSLLPVSLHQCARFDQTGETHREELGWPGIGFVAIVP